jgi:uncharacterized membrane protein
MTELHPPERRFAVQAWRVALAILLLLMSLMWFGMQIPLIMLAIVALITAILVLVGI